MPYPPVPNPNRSSAYNSGKPKVFTEVDRISLEHARSFRWMDLAEEAFVCCACGVVTHDVDGDECPFCHSPRRLRPIPTLPAFNRGGSIFRRRRRT